MTTNRISKYLIGKPARATAVSIPTGFVVVPSNVFLDPAALSNAQFLQNSAYAAARAQAESRFLEIMRSLKN